ncbi:acyl-CoA dehydrogenase [Novosphingobium resinovorum]|uniref:Acyl-CoA dehydrogenase n=1 Tax=Novosphingobium resinovorum TaxID=158500 RepID=A0A1D8A246_9SPHN|nr:MULTISPECIES: acyl-CoA dehydrogenase [Sphingomonadaceae]AOR76164.1 acyl-CoA dehydrogenase [Novosphingobium resinovorum]EJU09212.1 acyl-CoA dehydrogenase domain-containing protein [Sphingomonas sp. LH128]MBF7011567.1 acyl-CoA dehydrogenase [Novosphingobium sp. HR1a]WJM29539.1 acyl-CoA dehydrogenase [Novosphingobium resinovorum]
MNFDLTDEQEMMRDTFARFLDEHSSTSRVRKAQETDGFDAALWSGLAELGAFAMRVPEDAGGMDLGLFDTALLMEEAGRTLVSGPLAEALVAVRLLGQLGGQDELLEAAISGEAVVTIAMQDTSLQSRQWIAGGSVAKAIIARRGSDVVLVTGVDGKTEPNLATTPVAQMDLAAGEAIVLGSGEDALALFAAALEEWKLYMAVALSGIGRQALQMAAAYAGERKAFGQLIGTFQGISHPLADLLCDVDGAKFLAWKAIRDIYDNSDEAAATISLAYWYACDAAARSVAQGLHTFGGYGLSNEYDVHLYNLRAKAWPLVAGDPALALEEAGRRLYAGETVALPASGEVPLDFDLGDEARQVCAEIAELFATKVTPEQKAKFHYSWEGYVPEVHKMLAEHSLLFPGLPEHLSGRNITPYARIAAMGEMERQGYNTPGANVAAMVAMMIDKYGSDELKAEVLPRIVGGDVLCSLGYSEPSCGSDVFAAQCKATQLEDGSWRIDGTKMWTSGANLSSYVLMLTRTNPDVPKHKGLTMFIVPLKTEGVTVQAVHTFQDERTNITFYDGVVIPDSWRLGEIDGGTRTMSAALELEHGGGFSKVMKAMIEAAEEVTRELGIDGEVRTQCRLARAVAHLWVSDMLTYRAQWSSIEKKPNHAFGPMAKMYSSEKFLSDSRDLLDLTAPLSLSKREGAVALLNQCYRHAAGSTIYGGSSEVHRSMVAERGLGLPRTRG